MKQTYDILAVDLDGTLLRSDMLFESFWSALSRDWRSFFGALKALRAGRPSLKSYLAQASDVDVQTLPYDPEVIAYIRQWRQNGGRTALVTATDEGLARRIADHLGLFDAVHGSRLDLNLKGQRKAAFLEETFGHRAFAYIGDARADLPVWAASRKAVTVNAAPALRDEVAQSAANAEHLRTRPSTWRNHVKTLRPHQWVKNVLVFLPILAAHQIDAVSIFKTCLAFVAFSMIASSVYVLNDLLDLGPDRAHPRKSTRPFAAGDVPLSHGTWLGLGTFVLGLGIALSIGWSFTAAILVYYLLTLAYSLRLKRMAVVDICVLAGLYTMRLIAGGAATGIDLSVWLLAFSIFFFLALAAVKRQAELVDAVKREKIATVGRGYQTEDLPIVAMIGISAGMVSVLVMALYLNSVAVTLLYTVPEVLWGICPVLLYWTIRMVILAQRGLMHDDPIIFALKDRASLICGAVIAFIGILGATL